MKITDRFTAPPAVAGALFVPVVQIDRTLYVSGHIARREGKPWIGRLGETMTTVEGQEAARAVAIDLLGTLQAATDLTRIKRIAKLLVLINSASTFTEPHLVANGASELFREIFGEQGVHARSAIGVAQLPFGSCVEIELIAELA
ncbi:MAG: RidA family protein [Thermoanaerobaculia bacterium]